MASTLSFQEAVSITPPILRITTTFLPFSWKALETLSIKTISSFPRLKSLSTTLSPPSPEFLPKVKNAMAEFSACLLIKSSVISISCKRWGKAKIPWDLRLSCSAKASFSAKGTYKLANSWSILKPALFKPSKSETVCLLFTLPLPVPPVIKS